MPELMDEKIRKELKRVLGKLPARVEILCFTQENACPACRNQQRLLEEVAKAALSAYNYLIQNKFVVPKAVIDSRQQ